LQAAKGKPIASGILIGHGNLIIGKGVEQKFRFIKSPPNDLNKGHSGS